MSTFKEDRIAADNAAQREANLVTYKTWLETNPKVSKPGWSVTDCIANQLMMEAYVDFGESELTAADFDFAVGNLESHMALQKVLTPEQVIAAENKHRKSLSLPQLQELSRTENPRPQRGELPKEWYGSDVSTAAALRALAKSNIGSFKALVARFGTQAVDERLGVQPAAQVGRSFRMKI